MKKKKLLKLLALVFVALYLLWKSWCGAQPEAAADASLLMHHPWLERMPESPRETVESYLFPKPRMGAYANASAFHLEIDLLEWSLKGSTLSLRYLQEDEKKEHRVRTWKCGKDAPEPFDLCLDLDGKRYYSREDWEVGSLEEARHLIFRTGE